MRVVVSTVLALALVLSVGLAMAAPVAAEPPAEVWVCVTGDDDNSGTEADPFKTIQKGINEVAAGGTVHVKPGTYSENVTIEESLTLRSAAGADETTITGLVTISLSGTKTVVFGEEDAGFTVDRGNPVPDSAILLSAGNGAEVTISHNIVTGEDAGIRSEARTIAGGSTVTIEHNVITDNPGHGIHLDLIEDSTVSIESNQITDNGLDGIYIWRIDDAPKTVTIADNTITGNLYQGIHITTVSASILVIEDNDIQDNGAEGIYIQYVAQGSTVDIAGNTIGGDEEDEGNGGAGIRIYEILWGSTVTIGGDTEAKGNTISHNGRGVPTTGIHIDWVYTSDVIIEYNAITANEGAGVRIENIGLAIATVTIARNTITDNGEAGIYVDRVYSSRLIIEENTISRNGREEPFTGIHIRSVEDSDVTIEYNTISDNRGAGIYIFDIVSAFDTVTIARNTITDNDGSGIMVANRVSGSTLVIEQNTIRGNCTVPTTEDEDAGIFVGGIDASEVTIIANIVEDNRSWGIRFSGIGYAPRTVNVLKNTITGSDVGVYVGDIVGSALNILGNVITENDIGIQIYQADDGPICINFNNIFANVVWGLLAGDGRIAQNIDATHNWWGAADGPSQSPGSGDKVSDNVDFTPWLGAAITDQRTGCTTDRGYGVDAGAETDNVSATGTGGNTDTTVTLAEYVGNPTDVAPGFAAGAFFFDVHVGGSDPYPSQLVVEVDCPGGNCAGVVLKWFDGTEWLNVTPTSIVGGKVRATLSDTSNPTIEQLIGSPFGLGNTPHQPPTAGLAYPIWTVLLAGLMAGASLLLLRRRQTQS